jgi:putative IMPACT (imprinted ancient) family translation regulator
MVAIPYNFLERVRLAVTRHHGKILDEEFAGDITMTLQFPVETFNTFQKELGEMSAGKLKAEVIESKDAILKIE